MRSRLVSGGMLTSAVVVVIALFTRIPVARSDSIAYLIDVTVRPGYHFPDAGAALSYGQGLCDKVSRGQSYAELVNDVKYDFNSSDDYQASYLIDKSVNELCPALIWQLRNSAAHYQPAPG